MDPYKVDPGMTFFYHCKAGDLSVSTTIFQDLVPGLKLWPQELPTASCQASAMADLSSPNRSQLVGPLNPHRPARTKAPLEKWANHGAGI